MYLLDLKFLVFSTLLFFMGLFGLFAPRKNMIIVLMAIELTLLAGIQNFVFFACYLLDILGVLYSLAILTLAASESAIGLALLVLHYRHRALISVDGLSVLKG